MDTMISDLQEETWDFDWFSVDANGEIAHFTSGGRGFLPLSVKASVENSNTLIAFFRTELPGNDFMADHSKMAPRGFYIYDCIFGPRRPSGYQLVAKPKYPLKLSVLPQRIQEILKLTQFAGEFSKSNQIEEKEFD